MTARTRAKFSSQWAADRPVAAREEVVAGLAENAADELLPGSEPRRLDVASANPIAPGDADVGTFDGDVEIQPVNAFDNDFMKGRGDLSSETSREPNEPARLFEPAASEIKPIPGDSQQQLTPVSSVGSATVVVPTLPDSIKKRQQKAANLIREAREKLESSDTQAADDLAAAARDLDTVYQLFDDRPELVIEEKDSAERAIGLIEEALADLRAERIELAREKTAAAKALIMQDATSQNGPTELSPATGPPAGLGTANRLNSGTKLNERVSCRIQVKRIPASAASDVVVSLELPAGSRFEDASGPVDPALLPESVIFAAIPEFASGKAAAFNVTMTLPPDAEIGLKVRIHDSNLGTGQTDAWGISIERLP